MTNSAPTRHVSEMTVAEIEAFERSNGISKSWLDMQMRRANREQLDRAAMARRTERASADT